MRLSLTAHSIKSSPEGRCSASMDIRSLYSAAAVQLRLDGHSAAAAAVAEATLVPPRTLAPGGETHSANWGGQESLLDVARKLRALGGGSRTGASAGFLVGLGSGSSTPLAEHLQLPDHLNQIPGRPGAVSSDWGFSAPPDDRDYAFSTSAASIIRQHGGGDTPSYRQPAGVAIHKKAVRCVAFSMDGTFAASGSSDMSVKVMETGKLVELCRQEVVHSSSDSPFKKAYYDHSDMVEDLAFHPAAPVLASCSHDATIRFYDFSESQHRRSFRQISDSEPVRSIAWHPAGQHLYAAVESPALRIYDVNTRKCWLVGGGNRGVGSQHEGHAGAITKVHVSWSGVMFATASKDGSAKIWDATTNRCLVTIPQCHGGSELTSVQFTRSDRYLLTSGRDGFVRVWDVSTGRTVVELRAGGKARSQTPACWSFSEEHIFASDGSTDAVQVWDSRTGQLVCHLGGHVHDIRSLAASPAADMLLTGGADSRLRLWTTEQPSQVYQWPTPTLLESAEPPTTHSAPVEAQESAAAISSEPTLEGAAETPNVDGAEKTPDVDGDEIMDVAPGDGKKEEAPVADPRL